MNPKYRQLYERLCAAIDNGEYAPGSRLPIENEMAQWGYSRNTVRQALALLEEEGTILKRRGSGSTVRPLRNNGKSSGNIAIIFHSFKIYLFPDTLVGINEVLRGWGTPMLYETNGSVEEEARILAELETKDVDGVIVQGFRTALPNPNLPKYQALIDKGLPFVFLYAHYPDLERSPHVLNDDQAGGREMVQYLYEKGYRKPCAVFNTDMLHGHQRYQGFMEGCLELGMEEALEHVLWMQSTTLRYPEHLLAMIMDLCEGRDSIICVNDFIASLVVKHFISIGKKIPEDIAVVSFDNSHLCLSAPVQITSMDTNAYDVGRLSATKLKNILAGKHETPDTVPWTLVERQSS